MDGQWWITWMAECTVEILSYSAEIPWWWCLKYTFCCMCFALWIRFLLKCSRLCCQRLWQQVRIRNFEIQKRCAELSDRCDCWLCLRVYLWFFIFDWNNSKQINSRFPSFRLRLLFGSTCLWFFKNVFVCLQYHEFIAHHSTPSSTMKTWFVFVHFISAFS